jgi:threonine synthase
MSGLLTHLECSACRTRHDHREIQSVCRKCGKSLLVRYNLEAVRTMNLRGVLPKRPASLWRYRELLPVVDRIAVTTLGEGFTPLLRLQKLAAAFGVREVLMKDEAFNATGSFKARGLCLAVSKARELGIAEVCIPTAGNAGAALAAYASAAGMKAHVFMPADTPAVNIRECRTYGADVHLVPGLISDAAKAMNAARTPEWFDVSTLKEPYRLEGKKTLGFEIAEQLEWTLPDVIVYPTGGGTGLIGMWKAFEEMEQIGWITSPRPKMVAVQSAGCAPIVQAFERHANVSEFWSNAATIASGIRVPKAFADELILTAIYESGGSAVSVPDSVILASMKHVAALEGVLLCPEGAATVAALKTLRDNNVVEPESRVLIFNTASGLKYTEVLEKLDPSVHCNSP